MKYEPIKDYEIDSLKRDISKCLASGNSTSQSVSSARRNIESAVQDMKRALSSLERNTDSRIRELQQQSSSSSRTSFGYSSYESGIRDARREADRAASKIADQLRNLSGGNNYDYGYSCGGAAERNLNKLAEALKKANSELLSMNRKINELVNENQGLKRKLGSLDSDVSKMAAGVALATVSQQEELRLVQRESEQTIAKLKREYDRQIKMLRQDLSLKAKENVALAEKIAARDRLDDDNWQPLESGLTLAEDYAVLWNDILEDNIVELREVRHIQKWLSKHKLETQEAFELAQNCDTIIARGEVLASDVQGLYDCSFRFLASLGAKLG